VLNTSATNEATKSSMKPQSGTTANHNLCGIVKKGMENKSKLRDASIGAAAVGKKTHFGTKQR